MEQAFGGSRTASERKARLFNVLGRAGTKARYTYDFGDNWEHQIVVEKRLAPEPGRAYPACLAGERHGPPEDCGGIPGFYNLLEAISDPEHEQHDDLVEWLNKAQHEADTIPGDGLCQRGRRLGEARPAPRIR